MRVLWIVTPLSIATLLAVFLLAPSKQQQQKGSGRYVASGYGGFVPAQAIAPNPPAVAKLTPTTAANPLKSAQDAYAAGHYAESEARAEKAVAHLPEKPGRVAAQAKMLMAFSAARRKDMSLARDRFAEAQHVASKLPDHG